MKTLDELAKRVHAYERCDTSEFQRMARVLQSLWRLKMKYPCGSHGGCPLGSSLAMPSAKETLANFLDDEIRQVVREEVLDPVQSKDKLFGKPRIFTNLLSSQPLAFNLFAHLSRDMNLATKVFAALSAGRAKKVTSIEFEYSPGRGDSIFTGDRSAFDVFVRFEAIGDARGFAGIEVKYHEDLRNKASAHHSRYDAVAKDMKCFTDGSLPKLAKKPLQQIWRDHLLAGSLMRASGFGDGFFVFLNPRLNSACNDAVREYRACLTDERTFQHWHMETVIDVLRSHSCAPWIAAFQDRYLAFDKIAEADGTLG